MELSAPPLSYHQLPIYKATYNSIYNDRRGPPCNGFKKICGSVRVETSMIRTEDQDMDGCGHCQPRIATLRVLQVWL